MEARTEFGKLVQQVAFFVGDRDLDAALAADLNGAFGYGSEMHDSLGLSCGVNSLPRSACRCRMNSRRLCLLADSFADPESD